MKQAIIFTDLDGTLLDATTYSYAAAQPALARVTATGTPLVFCSSKTRAEIEVLRTQLGNHHPFIAENGGGIFIPPGYFPFAIEAETAGDYLLIRLGSPYAEIRRAFVRLREQLQIEVRGFADMTPAEVAVLTGLTEDEALLARQRDFDEAFVFDGAPDESLLHAIEAHGLRWTQGRIFHVMGAHDKGRAVEILLSLYRRRYGDITSVALGDGFNDLPMLLAVDQPVLVAHADDSSDARIAAPNLTRTQLPGPAGWNEAVLQWLSGEPGSAAATPRQDLVGIFRAALAAADPYHAVLAALELDRHELRLAGEHYDLGAFERIVVVGAGKATARMAQAVEALLGKRIAAGLVVVKYDHTAPLSRIEQVEAAHPVPDEAGMAAAQRMLQMLRNADDRTLVICLLSGGASALLVAPAAGITLSDKQETTRLLLNAGASINELNAVRKHLSQVKGGRLAQAAYPARMLTLILSDVIGDPLAVIASGPTAPDDSTYADAWSVADKYGLREALPPRVVDLLRRGLDGQQRETPKVGDPGLDSVRNVIIAGNRQALAAAGDEAGRRGYAVKVVSATLQGEARAAAQFLAQAARTELAAMRPGERRCLLCGGETTVTVRGGGKGGRNQELALAFALEIEGERGIMLLSAGTDGSDGPTDAAGAIVDGATAARARGFGLEPQSSLDRNDSYTFFRQFDAAAGGSSHFKTGPTGTNVMDIQVVLLTKEEPSSARAD